MSFVLVSEDGSFYSKDKTKLLKKFIEVRVKPYYANNELIDEWQGGPTFQELEKVIKNEDYDITKMDIDGLFEIFHEYRLVEVTNLDD